MPATDTIVALSTPPGRSGIGVLRLSGSTALEILRCLVGDSHFSPKSHHVLLKTFLDPENAEVLDTALVTYFKSPRSFTGEDVVELSCHGSPLLLRRIIDSILRLGARVAEPGEFTMRALAHKRLNLSQAEAIRDVIDAQTDAALQQANRQLRGELSAKLQPFKENLLEIIVPLESSLEFVEDDLPEITHQQFVLKLQELVSNIDNLAATFRVGHLLRDGLKVTFAGRPNVGKSSIFNCLLRYERAIVSAIPGTTRDSLSELVNIEGVPVLLTDTAGVRSSVDEIETLGVERTHRAIADADFVVVVLDGSEPLTHSDQEIFDQVKNTPHIFALNKNDLTSCTNETLINNLPKNKVISLSAKTQNGIDLLKAAVLEPFINRDTQNTGLLITSARHFDLLQRTQIALRSSIRLMGERASEELILVGLYNALHFLGEITGETTPEDVLSQIFATFCIGK